MTKTRSLICVMVGHVDHGKSSILDKIRSTNIIKSEPGKITQAIGASIIPLTTIKNICGNLIDSLNMKFTIPGLLFIDTPGHAAFTNLRKRGGNLADIAIIVIDIREGLKPQTYEAIEILKNYKTPFIIAANKIDLIQGWNRSNKPILSTIESQRDDIKLQIEKKLYEIVGKLAELGLNSERFDRVDDYTKEIAIVPTSAETGEGIPELLMVITGLAQKFLEKCLECNTEGPAKGIILEVKEAKGLGTVLDTIIYDGTLKTNDIIVIGDVDQPKTVKIRALQIPKPLTEMRDTKAKFTTIKEIHAAAGVRISSPDIKDIIAGMPIRSATKDNIEQVKQDIQKEVQEVLIETEKDGIIIKGDTLGSLEALTYLLKEKKVKIRRADIGNINKKDITEAETLKQEDPDKGIILGFNVKLNPEISQGNIKIITADVIYKIIEDYEKWIEEQKKQREKQELENLVKPIKIRLLPNYIFRQNNPAVMGSDILVGALKVGTPLTKSGERLTRVKSIQIEQKSKTTVEQGKQAAVAMPGVTVGRQIKEGDILYSFIPEKDFRKLKEFKKLLKPDEIQVMKELAQIMRKHNPIWGV